MIQTFVDQSTASRQNGPVPEPLDAHVVILTNFLGPHHCKQLLACQQRVRKLTVLVSTEMEPNRDWKLDQGSLDVRVQKSWMITRKWRHRSGFTEDNYVHIPHDTGRQLRRLNPDVILSYEMGMRTLFSTVFRMTHRNCPLVMVCNISEQTEQGRGKLRSILRSWLRKRVNLVTSNGPGCTRYLVNQGYAADQILPFHYCHDADKVWQGPKRFSDVPSRLFYCGSLSERKGILPFCQRLVAWSKQNPTRDIELVLAGHGPLQLVIETLRRPDNLKIELLGSVDAATIRECYGTCDITAFPTLADEWGLVTNESLGSGTPMLSSRLAQSTEVLCEDGINSWVFDPRDLQSLDSALDRALNSSRDQLEKMSVAARKSVAGINLHASSDEFYAIIRAALNLKKNSAPSPQTQTADTPIQSDSDTA